ncbi:hypothetical protein POM88_054790 [Heracleum sosnowskyi]|uniref:DUF4283 domain-containing protein n=1 Tax=Heracleum sosnowskyi TaxID=360622 RepID=A0AAD8LW89_9APIA|nr:hypothetical protein POM88_054790 [Heracleum sosnowskyi]
MVSSSKSVVRKCGISQSSFSINKQKAKGKMKDIWILKGHDLKAQPVASLDIDHPMQPVPLEEVQVWITPTASERVMHAQKKAESGEKFLSDLQLKGTTPSYFYKCSIFYASINQDDTRIHNTYDCSSYNGSTIIHPPLAFFVNAENVWKNSCLGYFVQKALNTRSNLDKVENFMLSRFRSWGFNFIDYDDSGFFFFKFDNEEIRNKVISLGPVKLDGSIFVFGPLINKYPSVEHTLGTCNIWVKVSNIPRLYWNVEGLTYIVGALGTILRKDVGSTWKVSVEKNETSGYAHICVQMSVTHSRPKYFLVVVPGNNDTFTHARITVDYLDTGRDFCSLYCSTEHHEESYCPHKIEFEREFDDMECSADPLLVISEESSSTAASQADAEYTGGQPRGISGFCSLNSTTDEAEDSNIQEDRSRR